MSFSFGAGHGQGGLYSRLFLRSFLASLPMSEVRGETVNAHVELSDAVSNVVHHSEHFKFNKSTLGSIRRAVNALVDPVVRSLSFLTFLHVWF